MEKPIMKCKKCGEVKVIVNKTKCLCDDCNFKVVIPKRIEVSMSMKPHKKSDMKGW